MVMAGGDGNASSTKLLVEVGPRLSFESAVSSNAKSVCRASGLDSVTRLEVRAMQTLLRRCMPTYAGWMCERRFAQPIKSCSKRASSVNHFCHHGRNAKSTTCGIRTCERSFACPVAGQYTVSSLLSFPSPSRHYSALTPLPPPPPFSTLLIALLVLGLVVSIASFRCVAVFISFDEFPVQSVCLPLSPCARVRLGARLYFHAFLREMNAKRPMFPVRVLQQISRRFLVTSERPLGEAGKACFLGLVHDRMTEMEYTE